MEETIGKQMTGAQMVMESFVREGVDTIFGLPGGANLPLYDVLEEGGVGIRPVPAGVEPRKFPIKHYLVKHEQAAAHAGRPRPSHPAAHQRLL